MSDEINRTQHLSPRDYSVIVTRLSDKALIEVYLTNQWLAQHIQMSDCDYAARFLACQKEIEKRNLTLDLQLYM